ncbi:hypothetical protein ACYJW8_15395 [Frateuria aurantia]
MNVQFKKYGVDEVVQKWVLRRSVGTSVLVTLICLALVISRRPDAVLNAQFWAEDGHYWYPDAYRLGAWVPLLMQQNGYLQTVSRVIASASLVFPLAWAPLFFNLCAIGFQILPVIYLNTSRGRSMVPNLWLRLLICLLYLGHPYSGEVHANVTNIHWHLALLAAMILAFPRSSLPAMQWLDGSLVLLSSLSGPFSLFLAPVAAVLAWSRRTHRSIMLASVVIVSALIQTAMLLSHHTGIDRTATPLGASASLLLGLFAKKVVLGALMGDGESLGYALIMLVGHFYIDFIVMLGVAIFLVGFCKSNALGRAVIALGCMVFAASLASPQLRALPTRWDTYMMAGQAGRYVFLPIVAFYAALVRLISLEGSGWVRRIALIMLTLVVWLGVFGNWNIESYSDFHFQDYSNYFRAVPKGVVVNFPLNPGGNWFMSLQKK